MVRTGTDPLSDAQPRRFGSRRLPAPSSDVAPTAAGTARLGRDVPALDLSGAVRAPSFREFPTRAAEAGPATLLRCLFVSGGAASIEDLERGLREKGCECLTAADPDSAMAVLSRDDVDIVLFDITKRPGCGPEFVRRIAEMCPETFVVAVSEEPTFPSAMEVLRAGAVDCLPLPQEAEPLLESFERLIARRDRIRETGRARREFQNDCDWEGIVGRTPAIRLVFDMIRKVSSTPATVLITGESGTGKDLVARAIHADSAATRDKPFVAVNCASLPEGLLESELFGHVRGSFTGAMADKKGLFELADGGTIFLDEISEMSEGLQAKFLRVVEGKEVFRVGGLEPIRSRARILCSSNRDFHRLIAEKKFREDLYYRINVVEIRLPPLRERVEDIPHLALHVLSRVNAKLGLNYRSIDNDAMRALMLHPWTGNVREFENTLERCVILGDGRAIHLMDLPPAVSGLVPPSQSDNLREFLRVSERVHIQQVLRKADGNKDQAARWLGIGVSSLYRKIAELDLQDDEGAEPAPAGI